MQETFDTPVLFIIFNRPDTTRKVFDSIANIKPRRLYVAADGARAGNVNDELRCAQVREIIEEINWEGTIKKLYRQENLGCFKAVSEAINWFFQQEEMGIIIEDDCLPNRDFYFFCQEMLYRFKDNHKIISVNGSNLGYKLNNGNGYTFSRFMNMWGWATWKRSAASIDYKLREWKNKRQLHFLHKRLRNHFFDFDINWYKYWQEKFDLLEGSVNPSTWDWQWIYNQLDYRQLSVVPAVNLVSNLGFNADATHTHLPDNPAANLPVYSLSFPLQHPVTIAVDYCYEEEYVKKKWCYYNRLPKLFYIKKYIKNLF